MNLLTLQDVFGANSTQDSNTLTVSKSDLISAGLTPVATNTAESILIAIILNLLGVFSGLVVDSSDEILVDSDGVFLGYQDDDSYQSFYAFYWRKTQSKRQGTFYINDQLVINEYTQL